MEALGPSVSSSSSSEGASESSRADEYVYEPPREEPDDALEQWIADNFEFAPAARAFSSRGPLAVESALAIDLDDAAAAIDAKIDPGAGNMDQHLASLLYRMYDSPTYLGATPAGSPNGPVWFRNFYLDEKSDPNMPDAQVYSYLRDGQLATFEVAGTFSRAYASIDPGRAGSNSGLGLPTSGRELMQPADPDHPVYFQNFENGKLVENSPGNFSWYDRDGRLVKKDFQVPVVDLERARSINGGVVQPISTPPSAVSEFSLADAEGAPADNGVRYHAAKDWFAPGGTPVRSPIDGEIVGVYRTDDKDGQVFGGHIMVRGEDGRVWVFRHVDPAENLKVGDRVVAGQPIAAITAWTGGPPHAHVELWKTLDGGYDYENMIDPMTYFRAYVP